MYTSFNKIFKARQFLDDNIDDKLFLFGHDLTENNHQSYHVTTHLKLFQILKYKKISHYYEHYTNSKPIKLFFDFDYTIAKFQTKFFQSFDDFYHTIIDYIKNTLSNINMDFHSQQIIVLNASTENKYSLHIIFPKLIMHNVLHIKELIENTPSYLVDNNIVDTSVYKNGCLRILYSSKYGKNNALTFFKSYNYIYSNDITIFMDSLLLNIDSNLPIISFNLSNNIIDEPILINNSNKSIKSIHSDTIHSTNYKFNLDELSKILNLININRTDDYNDWIKIGMSLKYSNPNSFYLWLEWSKISNKFTTDNDCLYKWNSFTDAFNKYSIGTLKWFAKKDNSDEYHKIYSYQNDDFIDDNINKLIINLEFLLSDTNKLLSDKSCPVSNYIDKWNKSNIKSLLIKSPYGSGKTRLLEKIINEYNPKRILFVSYRKTLTNDLYGAFSKYGFEKYTNRKFHADRLICQIDSLNKINDFFSDFLTYDLVILDEIESILNHFNAHTLKEKEYIFDLLRGIVYNSPKCIMLDGDIHNRTFQYVKNFGDFNYIINTFPKSPKKYIFHKLDKSFDKLIYDCLDNNKKIVIVSMTSGFCDKYYNLFKDKYKVCIHTSKTDDELLNNLIDVNNYWTQFDIVIYSPTIEAGIDFNVEYFDYMFCVLSDRSTSQRGFLQMCARIRKLKDTNINVYLNELPFYENAYPFTQTDIKYYFNTLYKNHCNKRIIIDPITNKAIFENQNIAFNDIIIYNLLEEHNKHKNYFIFILLKLIKEKYHTYELYSEENVDSETSEDNDSTDKQTNLTYTEIINANNINQDLFNDLLKKQNNSTLTRLEKMQMEKFIYMKTFNTNTIDTAFMSKYYRKLHVVSNIKYLFNGNETKLISVDKGYLLNYSNIKQLEKKHILLNLLSKFSYNLETIKDTNKKLLTKEDMEKIMNNILETKWFDKNKKLLFGKL